MSEKIHFCGFRKFLCNLLNLLNVCKGGIKEGNTKSKIFKRIQDSSKVCKSMQSQQKLSKII